MNKFYFLIFALCCLLSACSKDSGNPVNNQSPPDPNGTVLYERPGQDSVYGFIGIHGAIEDSVFCNFDFTNCDSIIATCTAKTNLDMVPTPSGVFAISDTILLAFFQPLFNSEKFVEYRYARKSPKKTYNCARLVFNNGGEGLNIYLVVKNLKIYKK